MFLFYIKMDDILIKLRDDIEVLDKEKHETIFKIFKSHNIDYSENKNGIFINLSEINSSIIKEIQEQVTHFKKQEKILQVIEKEKETIEKTLSHT
jgi:hypothetical protein